MRGLFGSSATIRIDAFHDTGIYSVQQLYDIPYVTVNKLRQPHG